MVSCGRCVCVASLFQHDGALRTTSTATITTLLIWSCVMTKTKSKPASVAVAIDATTTPPKYAVEELQAQGMSVEDAQVFVEAYELSLKDLEIYPQVLPKLDLYKRAFAQVFEQHRKEGLFKFPAKYDFATTLTMISLCALFDTWPMSNVVARINRDIVFRAIFTAMLPQMLPPTQRYPESTLKNMLKAFCTAWNNEFIAIVEATAEEKGLPKAELNDKMTPNFKAYMQRSWSWQIPFELDELQQARFTLCQLFSGMDQYAVIGSAFVQEMEDFEDEYGDIIEFFHGVYEQLGYDDGDSDDYDDDYDDDYED